MIIFCGRHFINGTMGIRYNYLTPTYPMSNQKPKGRDKGTKYRRIDGQVDTGRQPSR